MVFGALHRGGHRFWDRSSVEGDDPPDLASWYDGALRELYRSADGPWAALVAAAPGAAVFVFSLHGMMVNTRARGFPGRDAGAGAAGPATVPPRPACCAGPERRSRSRCAARSPTRCPGRLKNRLMTHWTTGGVDWEQTRAFTLRADLNGYIRIN